ncbi:DUF7689 domain-containing protein [Longimicrobium sp.]|uniref:DUF7689 domain-containing protein n=1 Tax=Longimicrobium sp. TaxID=2029185 RepID=UPI003BEED429
MDDGLRTRYPRLARSHFVVTSPPSEAYNCIAWAAGHDTEWWDPLGFWWPRDALAEWSLRAMLDVFRILGYSPAFTGELETGIEKIAIYGFENDPKHVTRQLESGHWTSKLGKNVDIEHELDGLCGSKYGEVLMVMSRPQGARPRGPIPLVRRGVADAVGA